MSSGLDTKLEMLDLKEKAPMSSYVTNLKIALAKTVKSSDNISAVASKSTLEQLANKYVVATKNLFVG